MKKILKKLSSRGFTLVEVLLAAAILASAISAILMTYYSCFVLISTSKNINITTDAAMGLAEEIRNSAFSRIVDDYNGLNFIVNDIPQSRGVVYVDDENPELLQVTISVCWRQGNRVIGEDTNLNGQLDAGEVDNGNNIIDSPVQIVTIIANR
jgi:prepilin-type N-terminal cleavage/methylation domain-containing protein